MLYWEQQEQLAKDLAERAHKGQTRWDKKTPYITHPAAIVEAIKSKYSWAGETLHMLCAVAWLHDVVEDTDVTLKNLKELGFDEIVIENVDAITKKNHEEYYQYLKRISEYYIASVVKIEDITHNLTNLKKGSMRDKYLLAIEYLKD